jgi:hypothetical protein
VSREPLIVRVIRHLVEEELEDGHHAFVVDVSEIVNPILERLDALMEASQTLGGEVEAVIQAVRDAEARVQAKVNDLEAEIKTLSVAGGASAEEEQALAEKLHALREEVAGIVPAATTTPPPVDTPPAGEPPVPGDQPPVPGDTPPPADAPPVEEPAPPVEPGGDAAGEPAPGDAPAPGGPVDAPVDAPPADTGTTQAP